MYKRWSVILGQLAACIMLTVPAWAGDNHNGTITDYSTGLVWLQNAGCLGMRTWADAKSSAAGLKIGTCGLTSGGLQIGGLGNWRLPTNTELAGLQGKNLPFTNLQNAPYWSATESIMFKTSAAAVNPVTGNATTFYNKNSNHYVLAVRK